MPPEVKLPMLPRALMEFTQLAKDPNADVRELSRIIATDSGLSTALLRRAQFCRGWCQDQNHLRATRPGHVWDPDHAVNPNDVWVGKRDEVNFLEVD